MTPGKMGDDDPIRQNLYCETFVTKGTPLAARRDPDRRTEDVRPLATRDGILGEHCSGGELSAIDHEKYQLISPDSTNFSPVISSL